MTRLILMPAFLLAENLAVTGSDPWMRYGLPGLMILLIAALWREDRNARIQAQTVANNQYVDLVAKLLATVETNTGAVQSLRDALQGKVAACPFDGKALAGVTEGLVAVQSKLSAMDEYAHRTRHDLVSMLAGRKMIQRAEEMGQD